MCSSLQPSVTIEIDTCKRVRQFVLVARLPHLMDPCGHQELSPLLQLTLTSQTGLEHVTLLRLGILIPFVYLSGFGEQLLLIYFYWWLRYPFSFELGEKWFSMPMLK